MVGWGGGEIMFLFKIYSICQEIKHTERHNNINEGRLSQTEFNRAFSMSFNIAIYGS